MARVTANQIKSKDTSTMQQSTPLDSLDSAEGGDEQRVQRILSEMSGSEAPRIISEKPITTSIGDVRMDPTAARAHIIGHSAPSMADFQSMLFQAPPGMTPIHRIQEQHAPPPVKEPKPAPTSIWTMVLQQIRAPLVVVGIVFFLNLPIVTSVMSRYASWMYLGSGEISISGLIVKALMAGTLFGVYQVLAAIFSN
jgi:hypothetical protein